MALNIHTSEQGSIGPSKRLDMQSDRVEGRFVVAESFLTLNFDFVRRLASSQISAPTDRVLSNIVGPKYWGDLKRTSGLTFKETDPNQWILKNLRPDPFRDLAPNPLDFGQCTSQGGARILQAGYTAKSKGKLSASVSGNAFALDELFAETAYPKVNINQFGGVTVSPNVATTTPGQSIDIAPGHPCGARVTFNPLGSLDDGHYTGTLRLNGPDGDATVQLLGEVVTIGELILSGVSHVSLVQGRGTSINLSVKSVGSNSAHVTVSATELPGGVTLQPAAIDVAAGATQALTLRFDAAADASVGKNLMIRLAFHGAAHNNQPSMYTLQTDVYSVTYQWTWRSTKTKVEFNTDLLINADGDWVWSGHLYDTSTWYGDNYLVSAGLPYKDPNTGKLVLHYVTDSGTLGAEHSGGARNGYVNQSGTSANLAANFFFAVDHGPGFRIHIDSDPIDAIVQGAKEAIDMAAKYGPEIATIASL